MENRQLTPLKAIRAKCLECMAGQANEVKLCPCDDCPLYGFRMGHGPAHEVTEEERERRREQGKKLSALRTAQKNQ